MTKDDVDYIILHIKNLTYQGTVEAFHVISNSDDSYGVTILKSDWEENLRKTLSNA